MLEIRGPDERGARLVTTAPLAAGQEIASFAGAAPRPRPTRRSIQVGLDAHVDDLGALANLNHSCRPNALVDAERRTIVALRDLAPGEELTLFYPSTEWAMVEPFDCLCAAPECIGRVRGARDLPREVLTRYRLSRHVRALLGLATDPSA